MSHYSPLFGQYLIGALQESVQRVQAADRQVPDSVRRQAWHLLSFALNAEVNQVADEQVWYNTRALVLALAAKMEQAGFREEWIAYLVEAHRHSQAKGDWLMVAECELQMGLLYRLMSRFDDAQLWSIASVTHFSTLGDNTDERRALNELAWLEQLQHKYAEATRHVERALALANEDDIERGMSLRVLGMIASSQRHWQKAQALHEQALAIFQRLGDQRKLAWSIQNLALSLHEQSEFEKAIVLFTKAAQILGSLNDGYHSAIIQMNIGRTCQAIGKNEEALLHYSIAATTFYRMSDILNIGRVETNLGMCHYALHNYRVAEQAFFEAISAYAKLDDLAWKLNAVAGLGMTYIAAGQFRKAIPILEQALNEIDQIAEHPYYTVTLNFLRQYLEQAKEGQG